MNVPFEFLRRSGSFKGPAFALLECDTTVGRQIETKSSLFFLEQLMSVVSVISERNRRTFILFFTDSLIEEYANVYVISGHPSPSL